MALELMDQATTMPFFQANQVLTFNHLNDLTTFLFQQERYTRARLIGSGIVCGLTYRWDQVAGGNAAVLIDHGCAVTSAGYLIVFKQPEVANGVPVPYTHRRNFQRLKEFEPFKTVIGQSNVTIHELITKDVFDAETEVPKGVLTDGLKAGKVLILLYDIETLNVAKCLDESCDDKGKIYRFTPRPLLVPKSLLDDILDSTSAQPFHTEPGRGAKGTKSILFDTGYLHLNNLFKQNNLENINSPTALVNLFKGPCSDDELNGMRDRINALIDAFPWIFQTLLECMQGEVPELASQTLGAFLKDKARNFRVDPANKNHIQYLYDFLRDIVVAYNELYTSVAELVSECGGNEFRHPFHVMLGVPATNETLQCYHEEKFQEPHFKYRNTFVPSPVMNGQFRLYERIQNEFKRLIRLIAYFQVDPADSTIKISPSRDYDSALGSRAIPYFYAKGNIDAVRRVWDYQKIRRNKTDRIKGYHVGMTQDALLDEDTSGNDFYRIEGHVGTPVSAAQNTIDALRHTYNLPFSVASIAVQGTSKVVHCAFSDLDAEYDFYRDRVLGYLTEIERWLEATADTFAKSPVLKKFHGEFRKAILKLKDFLKKRCLEHFDYNGYKKVYALLWDILFTFYVDTLSGNTANVNQQLNAFQNILNNFLFKPLYRIWYMFQYRKGALLHQDISSLQSLATDRTGLEHLAGVRRGNTFLLVSDTSQNDIVVADFNIPDLQGCACDCKARPCDEKHKVLISPLQKPIVMVADYTYTEEKGVSKAKAFYSPSDKTYILELDRMGFYKADSVVAPEVRLTAEDGSNFTDLKAVWENEKLILRYKTGENTQRDGFNKIKYELKGDFDEGSMEGWIYLFVVGRIRTDKGAVHDVIIGGEVKPYYPYDIKTLLKLKPELRFDAPTKTRTIGGEKTVVFTAPSGNEFGIATDEKGLPYLKAIKVQTPGVDEIPVILDTISGSSGGAVRMNVINKDDTGISDKITGVITDTSGRPLRDVIVKTSGGKEVLTNEKGEYVLSGLKAGEVLTYEKLGYRTGSIQVNSNLDPKIKLSEEPLFNIRDIEGKSLPEKIGKLTTNLKISNLRNLLK